MELKSGMRVVHPLFGNGTVRAVNGSGGDARITVDFAGNVGQKKLVAGVANLQVLQAGPDAAPLPMATSAWYETLDAACQPRPGRRPIIEKIIAALRDEVSRQEFWIQLRELLRRSGSTPRVLDDPHDRIALSVSGALQVRIVAKHPELVRHTDAVLCRTIFDLLAERCLIDFEVKHRNVTVAVSGELPESDIVNVSDSQPESLPDRAPLRRPKPVQPKGTIRSRGKRSDDY